MDAVQVIDKETRVLIFVSKIAGVAPLHFDNRKSKFIVSMKAKLYSIIVATVLLLAFLTGIFLVVQSRGYEDSILKYSKYCHLSLSGAAVFVLTVCSTTLKQCHVDYWQIKFVAVKKIIFKDYLTEYSGTKTFFTPTVTGTIAAYGFCCGISLWQFSDNNICLLLTPFFISDFIKNIVVLQFLIFNSTTQRLSEQINEHLLCVSGLPKEEDLDSNISASVNTAVGSCTLTNPRKSVEKHRQYKQPRMSWIRSSEGTVYCSNPFAGSARKEVGKYVLLRKLRYAHCLFYEISRSVNVAFSTQNLVLMVSSFVSMVVLMYEIVIVSFDMILTRSVKSKFGNLVMCVAWVVQNTWRVCSLVYSSEAVVQEASRTENLVNKLMLSPLSSDCMCCSELQLFAQQLTNIRIKYTAANLLSLDYRIVKAVVGTVTTYMVILIQFRLSNMWEQ
ncbi:uncharacterized protein LOC126260477 [Schistocerca nitens]|uniref:uncharacterized protein LOC126260477 n=1 Tax=Schistocerca nitens TaxID=7011 RepID=UPI0021184536|nr:uncharacterized protein LOC126260477 [Schistocerca nitens]